MSDIGSGGANRIELESQILCSALRLSWEDTDTEGTLQSARELFQLFPDLMPPPKSETNERPTNLYRMLDLSCDVPQSAVVAGYFRAAKKFLRTQNIKDNRQEYYKILTAGFTLRKPRLRLSHDLIVVRDWLIELRIIPEDGTLEALASIPPTREPEPIQMVKTQPIDNKLPMLIELLKYAGIIGPAEQQALTNQMNIAPEVPLVELILSAGYVTAQEMKSLQLAEQLVTQGKITLAQFAVAMYDERTQGVKMAESLQVRGWLDNETKPYRPPDGGGKPGGKK